MISLSNTSKKKNKRQNEKNSVNLDLFKARKDQLKNEKKEKQKDRTQNQGNGGATSARTWALKVEMIPRSSRGIARYNCWMFAISLPIPMIDHDWRLEIQLLINKSLVVALDLGTRKEDKRKRHLPVWREKMVFAGPTTNVLYFENSYYNNYMKLC